MTLPFLFSLSSSSSAVMFQACLFMSSSVSRGRLSTLGLTFANTDLVNESGVVVAQMLRKLTDRLDVGAELLYQYGKQIPGEIFFPMSYSLFGFTVLFLL